MEMACAHLELVQSNNRLTGRLNFERGYVPLFVNQDRVSFLISLCLYRSVLGESFFSHAYGAAVTWVFRRY